MSEIKVVPCDMPTTLLDCPPGLFIFGIERDAPYIGFKSEYGNSVDNLEVFCVESGECFWGGTSGKAERAAVKVVPAKLILVDDK